ncbi:helix-turn-helix transcriptional regulator [Streptomyces echinatus]|uniref:helix-turn-helix domain-containing protein n=1 Tax=Streptomyces echinatus TaxID=67293 RepID=UPI0031EB3585
MGVRTGQAAAGARRPAARPPARTGTRDAGTGPEHLPHAARPALGRARRTGTARPHPDRRPASLTAQELRIARLAADGLTNKEIGARLSLSPRTVGGHLAKAFPKLGIASRAAVARALDGPSPGE